MLALRPEPVAARLHDTSTQMSPFNHSTAFKFASYAVVWTIGPENKPYDAQMGVSDALPDPTCTVLSPMLYPWTVGALCL